MADGGVVSIEFRVDIVGEILGTSQSPIHPIVNGEDLFATPAFEGTVLEFGAVEKSVTDSGCYQIFNCSCGVPACGGWEAGVAVELIDGEVTWTFELGRYRFQAEEYGRAVEECRRDLRLLEGYRTWASTTDGPAEPTVWATEVKAHEVLEALVKVGAKVATFARDPDRSPFVLAILQDDQRALELLLAGTKDLETVSKNGRRLLHLAALEGAPRCVELLLSSGADIHAVDRRGWTALDWSLYESHEETSAILKQHGASCKTEDERLADRFGTPDGE